MESYDCNSGSDEWGDLCPEESQEDNYQYIAMTKQASKVSDHQQKKSYNYFELIHRDDI